MNKVGTLPYSERLEVLNLTTLTERRIQGDFIEAFKAVNGIFCLDSIFNIGRSVLNLVSKIMRNGSTKVKSLRRKFLTKSIVKIWNKLPFCVKSANSVRDFNINL